MGDENPTTPPTAPPAAPAEPAPTPPPAAPPTAPIEPAPKPEGDGPILAAIGELKDMITGLAVVASTTPDETPAKRPWFARGGKS
jgi:hypothetical protein